MALSHFCFLLVALRALLPNAFCMWKPTSMHVPIQSAGQSAGLYGRRRYRSSPKGTDVPKVYSNFSQAADACLLGKSEQQCRSILCTEDSCTAPANLDKPGMLYSPHGKCYQPPLPAEYCDRRGWYSLNPCKSDGSDCCCDRSCTVCGSSDYCFRVAGVISIRACFPETGSYLCPHYFQVCSESPNEGKQLVPGANFRTSARALPPPFSAVQLGGGVKTKGCTAHGLSPIDMTDLCDLVTQGPVTQCEDAEKCSKRPYGCIVQKSVSCPSWRCSETKAVMNLHGQHQWCGVGSSEYDTYDCICVRQGNESGRLGQAKALEAKEAKVRAEAWEVAHKEHQKREQDQYMHMKLEEQLKAELKQWREAADRSQQMGQNAKKVAADEAAVIFLLTGGVLVCAVCTFGMVAFHLRYRYARLDRDAREPKISCVLQDAFVQADPTSEFSQLSEEETY